MCVSLGVKVQRRHGEAFRKALVELGVFDRCRKIYSDGDYLYLPVTGLGGPEADVLRHISDYEMVEASFGEEPPMVTPESILGYNPSFEVVGDIAVVDQKEKDIDNVAYALLSVYKHLKSVITPISDVEGEFRTRRFRCVAGTPGTATVHRENGLRYRVDLEKAYFSPRLSTERLRIARQVKPSEFVLDMFAGVGPFALLLAKMGARVAAIDKNPSAVKCLRENVALNKVSGVEVLEGDAASLALRYKGMADHVIMNLPHSASQFLVPAIRAARNGGIIHYYAFAPEDDLYRDLSLLEKAASDVGGGVDVLYKGAVRSYAPRVYNIVVDFKVIKD
jgi:tRNA (guanine37-N1)-methyltransferase